VRRWRRRYEDDGADGLVDRRVGQRSLRRAPEGELERMRALYQQHCQAFTIKHLHEKLEKRHGHGLGYTATGSISRRAGWCGRRSTPAISITDKRTRPLQERPGPLYAIENPARSRAPLRSIALASGIQGLPEPAAGRPCAPGGRLIARHAAKGESLKIHGIDDAQAHGD
jgi:hypothetical protein